MGEQSTEHVAERPDDPSALNEQPESTKEERGQRRKSEARRHGLRQACVALGINAVIAFATCVYVIVSAYQLGEIRTQVELARAQIELSGDAIEASREATRATARPWIVVSGTKRFSLRYGENVKIPIVWTNTGDTPAMFVVAVTAAAVLPKGQRLPNPPDFGGPLKAFEHFGVLGPGDSIRLRTPVLDLSTDVHREIQRGARVLYLYGDVTYSDVYGRRHRTRYCTEYDPRFRRFRPYGTYNSAD